LYFIEKYPKKTDRSKDFLLKNIFSYLWHSWY